MVERELSGFGGLAECVHCRWDQRNHGNGFPEQECRKLLDAEARHQNERSSQDQRWVENHIQTVNMIKRQETQNPILARQLCRVRTQQLIYVRDKVVVRDLPVLLYTRTQEYVRGATGEIAVVAYESPAAEDETWDGPDQKPEWFYIVRFNMSELWHNYTGPGNDTLQTEIPERWLEVAA